VPNVTAAIENAGGVVLKCSFETDLIDAAHFWLPGLPPLFFANRDLPGDRLRWALAHEVGHAILHRNYAGGDVENEADGFAAEFLLPAGEIARRLHDLRLERAAALKQHWKVPMAALIRHAHRLGCITPTKYKNLNLSLSSQGFRKNEPYPIPVEEPGLLRGVVNVHRTALGYDGKDLARLLFSPDPQFFDPGREPRVLRLDGQPLFTFLPERAGPKRFSAG
jgi:Zn-dependent peptidase ImmA (M78 family)